MGLRKRLKQAQEIPTDIQRMLIDSYRFIHIISLNSYMDTELRKMKIRRL